jgi:hypothetical protein
MKISRVTGEVLDDSKKSLNEDPSPDSPIWESFAIAAECFRLNIDIQDQNPLKYLCQEWNYPESFIKELFEIMGNSFDESNWFLNKLDGSDNLKEAWDVYSEENEIHTGFPFEYDTIEEYEIIVI